MDQTQNPGLISDILKDKDIRRSISNFEEVISTVSYGILGFIGIHPLSYALCCYICSTELVLSRKGIYCPIWTVAMLNC